MNNFLMLTKVYYKSFENKFSLSSVSFQLTRFSLHQATKEFLAFIKATLSFLSYVLYSALIDWLIFKVKQI